MTMHAFHSAAFESACYDFGMPEDLINYSSPSTLSITTMHFAARIITAAIAVATACSLLSPQASAFTIIPSQKQSSRSSSVVSTALCSTKQPSEQSSLSSRRSVLSTILATTTAASTILLTPLQPAAAATSTESSLITDLQTSYTKILQIPPLLQNAEWDKVRTILKTPPVNQLWNLGENQNTVVKLAKESGNFDLLELKDELAISLQMTDQYSYDNVFIYYQPGNGKVKTKEPLEMANKAIGQLKEILDVVSKSD